MTNNNQCNHTEAIAKEMYNIYDTVMAQDAPNDVRGRKWEELTIRENEAWFNVAERAIPIIGKHALNDVKDYLGIKASGVSSWWKKALLGLASAAVGALGLSLFQGCGHSVDVTPGRAEICKDGSCLVIEQGHLSYSQAQPETTVPPIVQVIPSKK